MGDTMKTIGNGLGVWKVLILLAGLMAFCSGSVLGYDDKTEVELKKAAVFAASYDSKGKIASVSLLSYEGEDYLVTPDEVSKQLIPLVEHTVNVSGMVKIDKEGRKVMTISKFEEAFN
jgi:hypothetical protein